MILLFRFLPGNLSSLLIGPLSRSKSPAIILGIINESIITKNIAPNVAEIFQKNKQIAVPIKTSNTPAILMRTFHPLSHYIYVFSPTLVRVAGFFRGGLFSFFFKRGVG